MADEKIYTNIGHATAYAYAKSKGYTGSEDQFATDQANFAANAQQVREDKESVEATVATFDNTTVPAAVQTVTAEGTRQVGIVGTAGDTQVARVQGEGTTQVGVVQTEGTTQKNAVQAKGDEVIASIPSDYTELTEEVEDLKSSIGDVEDYALSAYATDTASGAIATFPDGADNVPIKNLSVAIEPVQDLHGYDNPWPGGGGKNKLNAIGTVDNANLINGEYTITTVPSATVQFVVGSVYLTVGNYILNGALNTNFRIYGSVNGSTVACTGEDAPFSVSEAGTFAFKGLITASATMGQKLSPMIRLATEADATFAPYSNICPISGHTSANVTRTGKNLMNPESFKNAIVNSCNSAVTVSGNIVTLPNGGGNVNQSTNRVQFKIDTGFLESQRYTIIIKENSLNCEYSMFSVFYTDGTNESINNYKYVSSGKYWRLLTQNGKTVSFLRMNRDATQAVDYNIDLCGIFEGDVSYDDFEPFGTTYPITFPSGTGTVYGGHVTVNQDGSGELVVDRETITLDGSESRGWTEYSNGNGYRYYGGESAIYNPSGALCNLFAITNNTGSLCIRVNGTAPYIWFCQVNTLDGVSNLESWKTWLSNNPVQFSYLMPNPLTIPLTAPQIRTLLGTNNLWADCNGDVSVIYRADTALYISKKIAEALNA